MCFNMNYSIILYYKTQTIHNYNDPNGNERFI